MMLKKTLVLVGTILAVARGVGFADDLSSAPAEPALFGESLTDIDERIGRLDDVTVVDAISETAEEAPAPAEAVVELKAEEAQPACDVCQPAGAPPKPWKGLFYDNDFSYIYKNHTPLLGENAKEMQVDWLGCDGSVSVGGELRHRHMNEYNRLRPGGAVRSTYDLWRWRNYIDVRYSDSLRGYVEMLDASIVHEDLPATGIDLNRWNIQNAFVDLKIGNRNCQPVYLRVGRQELLYGSQRLVSPLDWANTRRNFEGIKIFSHGENWDFDAFSTNPVNTAAGHGPLANFDNERDTPDGSRYFSGVYTVFHGQENNIYDAYWLWDREANTPGTGADRSRHTTGGRWQYNRPVKDECCDVARIWHMEVEGGYQFGHEAGQNVEAGFLTAGVGHTWKKVAWTPSFWLFYDWASGDRDPNDGTNNTFAQLFPLGHAYLGLIDNVTRQNISDVNIRLVTKPSKKLTLIGQFHWMDLAEDTDVVY
ncbi:MAG: alginate export family protein, partial [Planctomycetaceae bacterium]|nr:alginate export family protein [Planctomycetaceae bacterium]